MYSYSYRPPRLMRAELAQKSNKRGYKKYIFGMVVLVVVVSVAVLSQQKHELLEAMVNDSTTSSSIQVIADKEETKISRMLPFLKTAPSDWKVSTLSPQQGVGGGPGLLKEALEAKAVLSVDFESGDAFYRYNSDRRMNIASVTKVMTAMTAMDLASMEEQFTVEETATEVEPTIIGVKSGERLSLRELIKGALLTSGNDAAAVIAEGIGKKYGGDSDLFIEAMNQKAAFLGLKNTHFTNPQGYDNPNHYSTCEDLAIMARYALKNYPEIQRIVSEKSDLLPANEFHHAINLPNWNMLIETYPGADGIKIGNTGEAGHTTIVTATREGKRVMAVVLGTKGILQRDMAAAELLNTGFSQQGIDPFNMTEDLLRERIKEWYQ